LRIFRLLPKLAALSLALVFVLLPAAPASAKPSTSITVIRLAVDGTTANHSITYTWQELRDNFEVYGDGETHYYFQGIVQEGDKWNPTEDVNIKDCGAVKGTNLVDLCDEVGGMSPGQELTIKANDGWEYTFAYKNVYDYSPREGPMVLTWYQNGKNPDNGYGDGMRVVWFADTSTNPEGLHIFGVWDWHEAAEEKYWYFNDGIYPTTTGISGKMVSIIRILTNEPPFWDFNSDRTCDIGDVIKLGLKWGEVDGPEIIPEDVNQDGVVNILDVVKMGIYWQKSY
jgi:hypothetical protein